MIDREALKAQQVVLKNLGYYKGEIDGIWSRKSIEAKLAFERSGKFNPGIPNRGMPFDLRVKLPISLIIGKDGYLTTKETFAPAVGPTVISNQTPVTPPSAPVTPPVQPDKKEIPPKAGQKTDITVDIKDLQ